jgi:hypothetical protein
MANDAFASRHSHAAVIAATPALSVGARDLSSSHSAGGNRQAFAARHPYAARIQHA